MQLQFLFFNLEGVMGTPMLDDNIQKCRVFNLEGVMGTPMLDDNIQKCRDIS